MAQQTFLLTLTRAGLDALVNAQNGETEKIVITGIGLSDQPVTISPTLEVLPGEFKRLSAVSGQSVSETVIHLTALDSDVVTYDVRSIGLFLADGTLFAAYARPTPIFRKVDIASFLFSVDVAFSEAVTENIEFGDASFLFPPASESVKGVAEIATQSEVDAGIDDTRIVTAKKLKVLLDTIVSGINGAIAALTSRTITGSGLATGGGDLSANRTINVPSASLAETNAGSISNKAVVPSGLATILANIAALFARTISGGGLVTGGGNLTANRTLTVSEASPAEITAGTSGTTVVTPRRLGPITMSVAQNGYIRFFGIQFVWGRFTAVGNGTTNVTFPMAFPNACWSVVGGGTTAGGTDAKDNTPAVITGTISTTGFSVWSADDNPSPSAYIAVGF